MYDTKLCPMKVRKATYCIFDQLNTFKHFYCLILFKNKVSSYVNYRVDLVSLTFILFVFFWFPLWWHIFQFRVQFPLQIGFLTGVHGFVSFPTPGVKNAFFAYSHPSMRLGFIPTAVNLKRVNSMTIRSENHNFLIFKKLIFHTCGEISIHRLLKYLASSMHFQYSNILKIHKPKQLLFG